MSIPVEPPPTFGQRLATGGGPLIGSWVCSGSPVAAEITAASGLDWMLFDGEHSPIGLESTASLLRAVAPYPVTPVVRVPALDTVWIKQILDVGAQNIIVPMVNSAEQAEQAAAAMFYPPRGVRGVGSALARSSRWNAVPEYLGRAHEMVSLTVQVESVDAVDNAAAIASVDGVDAVFVGPSDLAASMGYLGQQTHPEVLEAVAAVFKAVTEAGKAVGVNAFDPVQAREYAAAGAGFITVSSDVTLLAQGTRALAERWAGP